MQQACKRHGVRELAANFRRVLATDQLGRRGHDDVSLPRECEKCLGQRLRRDLETARRFHPRCFSRVRDGHRQGCGGSNDSSDRQSHAPIRRLLTGAQHDVAVRLALGDERQRGLQRFDHALDLRRAK